MRSVHLTCLLCLCLSACQGPEPEDPSWLRPAPEVRPPAPTLKPRSISLLSRPRAGEVGVPYALRLRFAGDVPEPARYRVESDGTPAWLLWDPGDAYLRFVPREAGRYSFMVGIGDPAEEAYHRFPLQIEIAPALANFRGLKAAGSELLEVRLGAATPGDASALADHRTVFGRRELASLVWAYAYQGGKQAQQLTEITRLYQGGTLLHADTNLVSLPAGRRVAHGGTWGWQQPGHWQAGSYQMVLSLDGGMAARVPFRVVEREKLATRVDAVLQPALQGVAWGGQIGLRSNFVEDPEFLIVGLPEGLRFDARTGAVAGTPTAAGRHPLWVGVRDRVWGHDSDTRAADTWYVPARQPVLEVRPEMDRTFWRLASDYELRRGNAENALDLAEQALGASADLACLLAQARALRALGQFERGFELLEAAAPLEPDPLRQLADLALLAGRGARAPEIMAGLRAQEPERALWVAEQARAHFDLGQWLEAEAGFAAALALPQTEVNADYLRLYRLASLFLAGDRERGDIELLMAIGASQSRSGFYQTLVGLLAGQNITSVEPYLEGLLPEVRAERQCEAWFFAAVRALADGKQARARELLDTCLAAEVERFWEHRSALLLRTHLGQP